MGSPPPQQIFTSFLTSLLHTACVQRWVRPGPHDFARLAAVTEGECFDVNAADPTGLLADVFEAGLLPPPPPPQQEQQPPHDAERGGAGSGRA